MKSQYCEECQLENIMHGNELNHLIELSPCEDERSSHQLQQSHHLVGQLCRT